jgi:hypothetical protein
MKKNLKKGIVPSVKKPEIPKSMAVHTCKNCQHFFEGNFCPSCGQSVVEVQQPITHFLSDLFGSVFALDIRLIRSVPILLLKPGRLSEEFVSGKRVSHVPPFRFYFFTSVVFFFLIGWQTRSAVNESLDSDNRLITSDSLNGKLSLVQAITVGDTLVKADTVRSGVDLLRIFRNEIGKGLADSTLTAKQKVAKEKKFKSLENSDVFITKVYQYASWSMFFLMPLFAFILYLVFRKKRKFYTEHLVYSVNLHTFFFMIAILALLLSIAFPTLLNKIGGLIFLFTVVYSIIGIRNFYRTRWVSAILSSIGIFTIYGICVTAILVLEAVIFLT